jgi:hypothetical protein
MFPLDWFICRKEIYTGLFLMAIHEGKVGRLGQGSGLGSNSVRNRSSCMSTRVAG